MENIEGSAISHTPENLSKQETLVVLLSMEIEFFDQLPPLESAL